MAAYLNIVQFGEKKFPSVTNTIPGAQGGMATLKFNTEYVSFLSRRWILKISYL